MKTPEIALAEWVSDAISFDIGHGSRLFTRESIGKIVARVVSGNSKGLPAELRISFGYANYLMQRFSAKNFNPQWFSQFSSLDEVTAALAKLHSESSAC